MRRIRLLIAAEEAEYRENLAMLLAALYAEMEPDCCSPEQLKERLSSLSDPPALLPWDCLLCNEALALSCPDPLRDRLILLTEERPPEEARAYAGGAVRIWRFAGAAAIGRAVLLRAGLCSRLREQGRKRDCRLVGLYGDVPELFLRDTLQILSSQAAERVLWLDLSDWLSERRGGAGELSDLLYYLFRASPAAEEAEVFLGAFAGRAETFFTRCGRNPLRALSREELSVFLDGILRWNRFDHILLSIPDDASECSCFFLERCDLLYVTPDPEDWRSEAKQKYFARRYGKGFWEKRRLLQTVSEGAEERFVEEIREHL